MPRFRLRSSAISVKLRSCDHMESGDCRGGLRLPRVWWTMNVRSERGFSLTELEEPVQLKL